MTPATAQPAVTLDLVCNQPGCKARTTITARNRDELTFNWQYSGWTTTSGKNYCPKHRRR